MDINNIDQMEALLRLQAQQAEQVPKKQAGQAGVFGAALAEALGAAPAQVGAAGGIRPPGAGSAEMISQMLLGATEQSQAADPDAAVLQEAFAQASGTLDLLDSYAKTLGSSVDGGSLREAYALLEGINSQVAQLRESTDGVRGKNPGLDSLLNELEVMAAAEQFKFNRGDYI